MKSPAFERPGDPGEEIRAMDIAKLRDQLTAIQKGVEAEAAQGGHPEPVFGRVIAHLNYCLRAIDEIKDAKRS